MNRIAQDRVSGRIAGDVPGVEGRDDGSLAGCDRHSFKRIRPDREYEIVSPVTEKCLVDNELIVAVFIEACVPGPVPSNRDHRLLVGCER